MVAIVSLGTRELLERVNARMCAEALDKRRSLSAHLESLSPTAPDDRSGLDAFERLMQECDIVSRSQPELGVYADTMEHFLDNPNMDREAAKTLFGEWCWRVYRGAKTPGGIAQAAAHLRMFSSDALLNTIARPYFDEMTLREDAFEAAVPVAEVLAGNQGVDGNAVRSLYLTEPTAAQKRYSRVGEKSPIPTISIDVGAHTIDMYKFGYGVELSYEVMRRESLDRLAKIIQLVSVQTEIDKLAVIIDVMVNGDGNSNTAATSFNLTTEDSGTTANNPTFKALVNWALEWENPYTLTHVLSQKAYASQLMLLNSGSANLPRTTVPAPVGFQVTPINRNLQMGIRLGVTSAAPANKWLGFDRRFAVQRYFEVGADIRESQRWMDTQREVFYFTEVEGFQVLSKNAVKILALNA